MLSYNALVWHCLIIFFWKNWRYEQIQTCSNDIAIWQPMENTAPALCPVLSIAELSRCFQVEGRSKGEAPHLAHCFHTNAAPTLNEAFNLCFLSPFSYGLKLQPLLVYSGQFRQNPAQPHGATWKESQEQCTALIFILTVGKFCKHIWWRWCVISSNDNFAK